MEGQIFGTAPVLTPEQAKALNQNMGMEKKEKETEKKDKPTKQRK